MNRGNVWRGVFASAAILTLRLIPGIWVAGKETVIVFGNSLVDSVTLLENPFIDVRFSLVIVGFVEFL
jgi:hypothetical protein